MRRAIKRVRNKQTCTKRGRHNPLDEGNQADATIPGAYVRITRGQQAAIDAENETEVNSNRDGSKMQQTMWLNFTALMQMIEEQHEMSDWSPEDVSVRLERLENIWQTFEGSWQSLGVQLMSNLQLDACTKMYNQGSNGYLNFKAKLRTRMRETSSDQCITSNQRPFTVSDRGQLIQIQLSEPPKLPKFSGLEVDWANFKAVFETEVHNSPQFSNSQKMRYLMGALQGRAEQIFKNWPINNDDSYNELWRAICNQYCNEYNTIRAHTHALYALRPIQTSSCNRVREVLDTARSAFRQLQLLLTPEKVAEYMLLHQLECILDSESQTQWALRRSAETLPTLQQMFLFLEMRASLLEQLATTRPASQNNDRRNVASNRPNAELERGISTGRTDEPRPACSLCAGAYHWPFKCFKFKTLPITDRLKYVNDHRMCRNCFSLKHIAVSCPDNPCPRCNKRHNSCLCPINSNINEPIETPQRMQRTADARRIMGAQGKLAHSKSEQQLIACHGRSDLGVPKDVSTITSSEEEPWAALLATAVVRFQIENHISPPLRALCDTGAQMNLINTAAIQSLQWSTQPCKVRLNGIDNIIGKTHTRKIKCKLLPHFSNEPLMCIELIVVPQITDAWLPHKIIHQNIIQIDSCKQFADPYFHVPAPVDVLLGAGVWAVVMLNGCFINSCSIAFQPSQLGCLVFGGEAHTREEATINIVTNEESELQLDALLRRFWEIEEISKRRTRTAEQEKCEETFMRTHQRLDNGRFQVDIPLRDDIKKLGSSRAIALHRFRQRERRFQRDKLLKEQYFNAVQELISADQMRLADRPPGPLCYHIPHHAVLKKFRVVYDASCPTDCGISLNDLQLVGEKLQDDLAQLIMRFRCHPVAVTADIKKMYLQVKINPAQWDLQRIFWRPAAESDIQEFWLTTVTFGLASAPHCAVRAMVQAARDYQAQFPIGAKTIEQDFYMDDCLSGAEDATEAKRLCYEMDSLLRSCGFVLSKWRSNQLGVVPNNENLQINDTLDLGEFDDTTVLGLRWLPSSDELMFKFRPSPILASKEATKRLVLSHIAKIFDPNGYVGPVVIVAKIIMQSIWKANISWDSPVPEEIYHRWRQFQMQLELLTEIRLPRWIGISNNRKISLHGFADASLMAYGAALYVRVESAECVECILITAKAYVAPVKSITIPRLELCAAKLLSELVHSFKLSSKLLQVKTTLWSDSQIVLAWLIKDPAKLKIFVNNRIQKIKRLTADADWRYVPSSDNPADLLSRGTSVGSVD